MSTDPPSDSYTASATLFASVVLSARIERAESRQISGSVEVVAARGVSGTLNMPIGGGVATWTGEGSPFNKVAGLGFEGPVEASQLDAIEREFADRASPVQIELSILADPSIAPQLCARGYVLQGFENVLGQRLPVEPGPPIADIEVAESGADEAGAWIDTIATGFSYPDTQGVVSNDEPMREAIEEIMRDRFAEANMRNYIARRNGALAGAGAMCLVDKVAMLSGAATLPDHRRRGVQTALLDRRLQDAGKAGCDVVVVTTLPGSKSHENVQKKGFHLLYTRAILVLQPSA